MKGVSVIVMDNFLVIHTSVVKGQTAIGRGLVPQRYIPYNLLVLTFAWFNLQALVVHLMDISCSLHVAQDVVLQLGHRLQGITHILVLLDVTNHLCCLCPLGKVDQVGLLDDGGYAIFNKCEIGQVHTCKSRSVLCLFFLLARRGWLIPKKGTQGGLAA